MPNTILDNGCEVTRNIRIQGGKESHTHTDEYLTNIIIATPQ